jgi:hypothetical protein
MHHFKTLRNILTTDTERFASGLEASFMDENFIPEQ